MFDQSQPTVDPAVGAVLSASDGLTVVLGLVISYIAFRGYRRNDSRAMLFVSLGFVLALGVPGAVGLIYYLVPAVTEVHAAVVTQFSELVGLGSIIYGLRWG